MKTAYAILLLALIFIQHSCRDKNTDEPVPSKEDHEAGTEQCLLYLYNNAEKEFTIEYLYDDSNRVVLAKKYFSDFYYTRPESFGSTGFTYSEGKLRLIRIGGSGEQAIVSYSQDTISRIAWSWVGGNDAAYVDEDFYYQNGVLKSVEFNARLPLGYTFGYNKLELEWIGNNIHTIDRIGTAGKVIQRHVFEGYDENVNILKHIPETLYVEPLTEMQLLALSANNPGQVTINNYENGMAIVNNYTYIFNAKNQMIKSGVDSKSKSVFYYNWECKPQ